ncbi:MAG: gliding motility-associated C-terminal domain-containing protein, partial [Flavobacteriales bacterium]|nr:gliding motility-associated C-terminal domain-containing protein [Flavobacteriales bacterium]
DSIVTHSYPTHAQYFIDLIVEDTICGISDTFTQSIVVRPGFDFDLGPDQYLCDDDSILMAVGLNNVFIQWSTGQNYDSIYATDYTTYYVRVSDSICVQWDDRTILEPFNNHEGYITHICYYGDEILLDAGDGAIEYDWSTGGDSRYILVDAANEYIFNVIDSFGCPRTDTIIVEAPNSSKNLYVPNAFTPNADLLNDEFSPIGDDLESYEFTIFNRWGDIIFNSNNINLGWDGNMPNGKPAPMGVYVYKLVFAKDCGDTKIQKKFGHFTLIR